MATNFPIFWGMMSQSEATAAQRTRTFLAVDATDGITPETGLDYEDAAADVQISKNGGAFANATGVVTELAVGVYQYVFAAAELDTLGEVLVKFVDAAARTVLASVQVVAADLNVPLATSTELSAVATDVDNIEAATPALRTSGPHAMGTRTTNGSFTPLSMAHAYDCDITITGTFNGATVTIEVCEDVTAAVPVWSTYDDGSGPNPLTAAGVVRVSGPHSGVRATLSSAGGSTNLTAVATMRSPL